MYLKRNAAGENSNPDIIQFLPDDRNQTTGVLKMAKPDSKNNKHEEAVQFYFSDGTMDIVLAATLLNFALDTVNQTSNSSLFTWIPILVYVTTKNKYFLPRVDLKKLGIDEQKVKYWTNQTSIMMGIGVLLLSTLLLADPLGLQGMITLPGRGDVRGLLLGVVCGIGFYLVARLIHLQRFVTYAAGAFAISLVSAFIFPLYVPIFAIAALILVFGFRLMKTFGKQNPEIPKKEEPSNED